MPSSPRWDPKRRRKRHPGFHEPLEGPLAGAGWRRLYHPTLGFQGEPTNGLYSQATSVLGVSQGFHVIGGFHAQTSVAIGTHVVAVANNTVGASANVELLAGTRSLYLVDCNDPDGCTIQLGTANVVPGAQTDIVNISSNANTLSMADVAADQHVTASFTMNTNDTISLRFITNRSGASIWVERYRADH